MMRVSLSILALLGSIKKNTPTVRVWDGLIPLGKVENENTSVSVPTHFEILGLWPLKNRNRYYNINTHNIWVSRYPPPKKNKTAGQWRWKIKGASCRLRAAPIFFVLASASFGSWWHHHHASVLPGQWFGRRFCFPIKMTCMRQLGGWKSIRCCLPCSNVYHIISIYFICTFLLFVVCLRRMATLLLIRQLPMATLRWPEPQIPPVFTGNL